MEHLDTLLTWPLDAVPIEVPLIQDLKKNPSQTRTPHYSVKWRELSAPLVPGLYKNADARMPLVQDFPPLLVDSTTHSTSLWLVYILPVFSKGELWKVPS